MLDQMTQRINSLEQELKETKEELNQYAEMLDIIRRNKQKQWGKSERSAWGNVENMENFLLRYEMEENFNGK